jgi:hypothetical protein
MATPPQTSESCAMPAGRLSRMNGLPFCPAPRGHAKTGPGTKSLPATVPGPVAPSPDVTFEEGADVDAQIRPEPIEGLIDELIEMYVHWREECIRLRYAYGRWLSVPAEERGLALASYRAALDREEQVSVAYAKHIERIRSRALL